MVLVDSHCHLDMLDVASYQLSFQKLLDAAEEAKVKHMLCVCVNIRHLSTMLNLIRFKKNIYASVGLHPNEPYQDVLTSAKLLNFASRSDIVAIGETGLDFYRYSVEKDEQINRFRLHIEVAHEVKKPLIIHTRQARFETIQVLREEKAESVGGVFHCFTEDYDMAKKALDLGFFISFSGILTFGNAKELRETAKKLPLNRILIETDAPYLAPEPYRGKMNEPKYVIQVAKELASIHNTSLEHIAEVTTNNFLQLFKITRRIN